MRTGGRPPNTNDGSARRKRAPARNPDERERQLIAYAVDLAEEQLRAGTASSQVITHYLKLGSSREELEKERIRSENELIHAKAEALSSAKKIEELYEKAIRAMRSYQTGDEDA